MSLSCADAWTRIIHCNGSSATNRMDYSKADIEAMAIRATRIKICTKGSQDDCATSVAEAFPIQMLRKAWTVSHNGGRSCDQQCVNKAWTGPRAGSNIWNTCGNYEAGGLSGSTLFYSACNNGKGLHLSVGDGEPCGWNSGSSDNLEVFIDATSTGTVPCRIASCAAPYRVRCVVCTLDSSPDTL